MKQETQRKLRLNGSDRNVVGSQPVQSLCEFNKLRWEVHFIYIGNELLAILIDRLTERNSP